MEAGIVEDALSDLEEAVSELSNELERLAQNIQALTEYQSSVLKVTKVLCSWMGNIEELAKHRKKLPERTMD
ncbi:hypothetical protein GDO86_013384 [Hymenochirus boettgeri]|uniref:Uncharacterized protein n=1 Tax=Hymenochirus boettgeri TaxID=247094 RepID=A0A8T2ITZ3_9PIPI|nr:hypothetical protein GDO86_013384 [Hymenochirus boettgeri]